jgi:NADPH-dependent 2,4-dienoyl-CoA reductase/sulfur reductase-like enzyme
MVAALELEALGVNVVVLDEGQRPGGQIFRQIPKGFRARERKVAPSHKKGHGLLQELERRGVEVQGGATVWDAAPGRLWFEQDGHSRLLVCELMLLATGAYDRLVPFPGWTLPGVITAGGAQVMIRGFMVKPGMRALVAGTGPLLLPTVTALLSAGVEVVGALEANPRRRVARALMGVLTNSGRLREALHYASSLVRAGVRLRMGWTAFAARGQDRITSAVIGRVDSQGRPRRSTAREVPVDLLCTGFGLIPSIELAVLLGCELRHMDCRGGWVPCTDTDQLTSTPGVYAAGEIAGIGGAEVAMAEGRVAALAMALAMGVDGSERIEGRLIRARRDRDRQRRAADALLRAFPVLPGLFELAEPSTLVCRCEDVTLQRVREIAALSGCDLRAVKMGTRAGMGPCQGRICAPILHEILPAGPGRQQLPPRPSVQVPVKPVSLETILSAPRPE